LRNKVQLLAFDKETVLIICLFGVFFGLGALFHELSFKFFFLGYLFGCYLGFAALPFIDSKKWKAKPKTCAALGSIGAMVFARIWNYSPEQIIVFGVVGVILGYLAPAWVKYM